jgi:hypothetical protein
MKVLTGFVVLVNAALTALFMEAAIADPNGPPFYFSLIVLAMLVGALVGSPSPITCDESGVEQRRLRFWKRYIPWSEVVEATRDPESECVVVRGKWGTCISFSPYLNGQKRFEKEILAHTELGEIPQYI